MTMPIMMNHVLLLLFSISAIWVVMLWFGNETNPRKLFRNSPKGIEITKIGRNIGSGSYGCIFECWINNSTEKLALKISYETKFIDLENELCVLKKIGRNRSNDYFVDMKDFWIQSNNSGIKNLTVNALREADKTEEILENFQNSTRVLVTVMELCDMDFLDLTQRGNTPPRTIWRIFGQAATAVACLHKKGIIHRDIKEENILIKKVNGEYEARLCDFGSSSPIEKAGGYLAGTMEFAPPRIVQKHNSGRGHQIRYKLTDDCYSLGRMIYELSETSSFVRCRKIIQMLVTMLCNDKDGEVMPAAELSHMLLSRYSGECTHEEVRKLINEFGHEWAGIMVSNGPGNYDWKKIPSEHEGNMADYHIDDLAQGFMANPMQDPKPRSRSRITQQGERENKKSSRSGCFTCF